MAYLYIQIDPQTRNSSKSARTKQLQQITRVRLERQPLGKVNDEEIEAVQWYIIPIHHAQLSAVRRPPALLPAPRWQGQEMSTARRGSNCCQAPNSGDKIEVL